MVGKKQRRATNCTLLPQFCGQRNVSHGSMKAVPSHLLSSMSVLLVANTHLHVSKWKIDDWGDVQLWSDQYPFHLSAVIQLNVEHANIYR